MFKIDDNTTWAIMAYESVADVGHKMTEWMSNPEQAKEAWMEFKQDILDHSHLFKSVIDSRYSVTVVHADGKMVTYAVETWI